MSDLCKDCGHWLTRHLTSYDDGSVIEKRLAPEGKGHCGALNMDTEPEFGCVRFEPGDAHEITGHKVGAPWQHWEMGPCPDCNGVGSKWSDPANVAACRRCAGTAQVRYYDDGHIGEERTRLHPKEKEQLAANKALHALKTCVHCKRQAASGDWLACPWCGIRYYEPEVETEKVSGLGAQQ